MGVTVGLSVAVGVGVTVTVGVGVTVGLSVAVGVGVTIAVGVGIDGGDSTVTSAVEDLLVSLLAVTETVALPPPTPVTTPSDDTVATDRSVEDQVTSPSVVLLP